MKPTVFTRSEGEDIQLVAWANLKESQETMQGIKETKYLLFHRILISHHSYFITTFQSVTRNNQELKKKALKRQYHSEDRQYLLRSELYALTQTGNLTQYIDQLEILCLQLDINTETKIYKFIHGLKPHLKEPMVL